MVGINQGGDWKLQRLRILPIIFGGIIDVGD